MSDAGKLLEALQGRHSVTLQTMYHGRAHRALYAVPVTPNLERLRLYNEQGSDVFFTVNGTSALGRTSSHVTELRAVFADYDYGVPDEWALPPTAIVRSSPGKAQVYWALAEPLPASRENLTQWQDAENKLVFGTGADHAARDVARVLRLPGFLNHKYTPAAQVELASCETARCYGLEDIQAAYAHVKLPSMSVSSWHGEATIELPPTSTRERRYRRYLEHIVPPGAGEGRRNAFFFRMACSGVVDFALEPQLVASMLAEYSTQHHGRNAYGYDQTLELTSRAASYGKGQLGSAFAPNDVREDLV